MLTAEYTVTMLDACRVLGLTDNRLRQLDDVLRPLRLPNGHRRYRSSDLQRFVNERAETAPACSLPDPSVDVVALARFMAGTSWRIPPDIQEIVNRYVAKRTH